MQIRISLIALMFVVAVSLTFPVDAAIGGMLKADLSLLAYNEHDFRALWVPDGYFSEILQHDETLLQGYMTEPLVFESLQLTLKKKSKKRRFAIQPKVLMKPFILVKELQNALDAYQAKRRSSILLSQPSQVPPSETAKTSEKIVKHSSKRTFWLNPYRNRLYGLHLEIRW